MSIFIDDTVWAHTSTGNAMEAIRALREELSELTPREFHFICNDALHDILLSERLRRKYDSSS